MWRSCPKEFPALPAPSCSFKSAKGAIPRRQTTEELVKSLAARVALRFARVPQKWKHKTTEWEALPADHQEGIMGRTKLDSIELENKPPDSHVARTDQDEFGEIFRRNMPYGTVDNHGTMFVGFSADQKRLSRMLDSMAGLITGTRDALTRYTQPLTGSYYFVPSVESLRRLR
jgi:putative iron-dependent peroxidase